MIKIFFSFFLVFILLFSGSVLATHEEELEAIELERIYIMKIMDEVVMEFQSYPDWNDSSLYDARVKLACSAILEAKYGIKFKDYFIQLKAGVVDKDSCPILLFASIAINGKLRKWVDERIITCIQPKEENPSNKIQVFLRQK